MKRLLLDTTFLIDAERGEEALDQLIHDDDDVAISAVTVAELLVGVRLATARHRARRQAYVDAVLATIPVTGYDVNVALVHAELLAAVRRAGRPPPQQMRHPNVIRRSVGTRENPRGRARGGPDVRSCGGSP